MDDAELNLVRSEIKKERDNFYKNIGYYIGDDLQLYNSELLTIELIEKYIDEDWDFYLLGLHPGITSEFIEKYIDKEWDFEEISKAGKFDIDFMIKYNTYGIEARNKRQGRSGYGIESYFDWDNLSETSSMEDIEKYIDGPWKWKYYVSYNLNLTFNFVKNHLDKNWHWKHIIHVFEPHQVIELLTLAINRKNIRIKWTPPRNPRDYRTDDTIISD